jgi:hypothetical protein
MIDPFIALFVSNVISVFLWGFYTCIFMVTIWVMRARKAGFTPVLIAICVLYCLNFAGSITQIYEALPSWSQFGYGKDESWANIRTTAANGVADLTNFLSIIIADSTMAWRMWIVWNRDWRVIVIPAITLSFGLVGGCFIVAYDFIGVQYHVHAYETWSEAMLAGTAGLNVLMTSMIVGRIYYVSHNTRKLCPASQSHKKYHTFVSSIVESGIAYTISALIFTILLHVNLDARLMFEGVFIYTVGIAPTLILLKLSLGYLQPSDTGHPSLPSHLVRDTSVAAPSSGRRDNLSCDLSDLESRDNTSSQMTETKEGKLASYDLSSPTTTMEGRESKLEIYVDTKANTSIV